MPHLYMAQFVAQEAERIVDALFERRVPHAYLLYPGEDHHFLGEGSPSCRVDAAKRIVDWVSSHLEGSGARRAQ